MTRCGVAALAALVLTTGAWAQSALTLETAMSQLGDFDYNVRTAASGFIRRLSPDEARPMLAQTVATHEDGYVRYRALVLLVGFGGSEARDTVTPPTSTGLRSATGVSFPVLPTEIAIFSM